MPYLALLDAAGIQEFIYKKNDLRSVARASEFLRGLTEPGGAFVEAARRHGTTVLFAAGGNMALCAESEEALKNVCHEISYWLIEGGTGLEVIGTIHRYRPERLPDDYETALAHLERRKLMQPRNTAFIFPGLILEREAEEQRGLPVEEEIGGLGYLRPNQTDRQLILKCDSEETDLMAVVSMDGIGMGKKLMRWMKRVRRDSSQFQREYPLWSEHVKQRWDAAWESAIRDLMAAFPTPYFALNHPEMSERTLWLQEDEDTKRPFLPVRKIYQGGDDLTYLCDARIALGFTRRLIHHLEQAPKDSENVPEEFQSLTIGAGIVFLDSHYPFIRAVKMAEAVAKNAKKRASQKDSQNPPSVMDWWMNRSGTRERPDEQLVKDGDTSKWAVRSSVKPSTMEDWDPFESEDLVGAWRAFRDSRGKIKALAEAASDGPEAVKELLTLRGIPDPQNPKKTIRSLAFLPASLQNTGFDQGETSLIDVAELFDIHFPLPISEEGDL